VLPDRLRVWLKFGKPGQDDARDGWYSYEAEGRFLPLQHQPDKAVISLDRAESPDRAEVPPEVPVTTTTPHRKTAVIVGGILAGLGAILVMTSLTSGGSLPVGMILLVFGVLLVAIH
jgi:hypothetical protein